MPVEGKYSIAICKGAALLNETAVLLNHWRPGESADIFAKRVLHEGVLDHSTAYRTNDIVRRVFVPRFLRPNDPPARILKNVLESHLNPSLFRELVLFYAARNDRLIRDFVVRLFWPFLRRGGIFINVETVLTFFSEAVFDGRIEKPWSEQVSIKVARGLLGFLRDIGFIREDAPSSRVMIDYRISDEGISLIARILHEEGYTDSSLINHDDWLLFGLDRPMMLERMHLLGEDSGILFQQAGSVVSINWQVNSIDDLIILLSRQRVAPSGRFLQ